MSYRDQSWLTLSIWAVIVCALVFALLSASWELAFVSAATLALAVAPIVLADYARIKVPRSFLAGVVFFVFATLFLGEVFDFYERVWWWDIALHGGSAIGFGLIGFLVIFMMFQRDRYAAPPFGIAVFAFCFAVSIGVLWELFEFAMDSLFGFNMLKSGLDDTMWDLILNMIGAGFGASAGWAYLKGRSREGLPGVIAEFIARNPRLFGRLDDDVDGGDTAHTRD